MAADISDQDWIEFEVLSDCADIHRDLVFHFDVRRKLATFFNEIYEVSYHLATFCLTESTIKKQPGNKIHNIYCNIRKIVSLVLRK